MRHSTVYDCSLVSFNKNPSVAGNLTVLENLRHLPFEVERVYYLYDIPGGVTRGSHAHYDLQQVIVAASGSFSIELDDGTNKRTVTLNRPYQGLLVVPGIWRTLQEFSSGSICLVLASAWYDEDDYMRDYETFLHYKRAGA